MIVLNFSDFLKPFVANDAISHVQSPGNRLKRHLSYALKALPSLCFTKIDQAFLVWGAVTLIIFSLALWAGLMSAGTVATVYGIFCSNVLILQGLCPLWLGLLTAIADKLGLIGALA